MSSSLYLLENITGPCSRIEYGQRGDAVEVLDKSRDQWLVQSGNEKFFVHPEMLSDARIENPNIDKKPLTEERMVSNKANPMQCKRGSRSALSAPEQGSLY